MYKAHTPARERLNLLFNTEFKGISKANLKRLIPEFIHEMSSQGYTPQQIYNVVDMAIYIWHETQENKWLKEYREWYKSGKGYSEAPEYPEDIRIDVKWKDEHHREVADFNVEVPTHRWVAVGNRVYTIWADGYCTYQVTTPSGRIRGRHLGKMNVSGKLVRDPFYYTQSNQVSNFVGKAR